MKWFEKNLPPTEILKQLSPELRQQYFAVIAESSDDAIIGKTLDWIILSWNKSAEKIL